MSYESKGEVAVASPEIQDDANTPNVEVGKGETANIEGAKTKEVRNAELFAALQESKINPWSKESFHLYFMIFIAFSCACANGYDGSLMTGVIDMTFFQNRFHTGTDGHQVSVVMSLYTVGSMLGAPFMAIICDRKGRKWGMVTGACIIIIGMIIISTSNTVAQIVVGRFVLGVGISAMTVAAPAYSIEVAPPHWRGRCTGIYNCGWFGGSIPAALIVYGCQYINNDYSWRIPLILQAFTCLIVLSGVWFIPESPRYLMGVGREEEAIAFFTKYHANGNANSRLVMLEVEEIRDSMRQESLDKASRWDYRPFIFTHNGRWRFAQVAMIGIFGQFSGNGLGYFNTQIFKNLGVSSTPDQLAYNILGQAVSAVGAITAVCLTDRMPRRKVLVWGTLACACMLAINAGLSHALAKDQAAHNGNISNLSLGKGALASYFLFNVINSFAYTPLQGVLPAEALDTNLRAKGLAAYGILVSAVGFINQFAIPISLHNIQQNTVWVFVGWDVIETILWYFFCVESQGRTLEELEWVYNQPHPVKASLQVDKVVVQADGHVTEKIISPSVAA